MAHQIQPIKNIYMYIYNFLLVVIYVCACNKMLINDKEVERVKSIKFLGVLLDEHLSWKEHIRYTENKIGKNIGLLYRA